MLLRPTTRYALSSHTKILMNEQQVYTSEILFEDQVILSDGRTKPYPILLQLTSESLIIQSLNTTQESTTLINRDIASVTPRTITIIRHPITRSFGFWIKGGKDTGFPVLISRVLDDNAHLLQMGDTILSINNEDVTDLTHDQVITKLRDASSDQVHLTVKYMNNIATYLHLTASKLRSSTSIEHNGFVSLIKSQTKNQKRMSTEYPSEYQSHTRPHRWSLMASNKQKGNDNFRTNFTKPQRYSLLYAYISQYLNGTDKLRPNSFQLYTLNGSQTGIIITQTSIQQNMWISRINLVIQNLTTRILSELNQTLLSSEQIFYATWIHQRILHLHQTHLPQWQAIFIVFKGNHLYIFDENQSPPLSIHDFIRCKRVYSMIEIFIETISSKSCINNRQYCLTLTLPNDSKTEYRYLNFERKSEYDDFISNYQRALYISVYSIQTRIFGCIFQGDICRLILDINKGFQMYNNETNIILWSFTFEQLISSSDNGKDKIFFNFRHSLTINDQETTINLEVQCQHLKILIHVLNAFLTIKFIGEGDDLID